MELIGFKFKKVVINFLSLPFYFLFIRVYSFLVKNILEHYEMIVGYHSFYVKETFFIKYLHKSL